MAAAILGAAKLVTILMSFAEQGMQGYAAYQRVTAKIKERRAAGQPVTQGDVWEAVGEDDAAKKALEEAIANHKD